MSLMALSVAVQILADGDREMTISYLSHFSTKKMTQFGKLSTPVPLGQLILNSPPPAVCGNILREVLNTLGSASKGLKTALRILLLAQVNTEPSECSQCESLLVRYADITPTHGWLNFTTVKLTFSEDCRLEQHHVVASLCAMTNLRHLVLLGTASKDYQMVYSQLARKAQFTLESFGSDNDIVEGLLKFLASQPDLVECSLLPKLNVPFKNSLFRKPAVYTALSNVKVLQTTAPVLTEAQFDLRSVRRLEYIGDGLMLDDQIRAVNRIRQLGPQLEALKFRWDNGKFETFLDVTKFAEVAKCTPNLRHLYLMNVDKNLFEEFVSKGLDTKTWSVLEKLIWSPPTPWSTSDSVVSASPDGRSIITRPKTRRRSTLSDTSGAPSFFTADRDFRTHSLGRDLLETFPSIQSFAVWNYHRKGHDVMGRTPDAGFSWSYRVKLHEEEWMGV